MLMPSLTALLCLLAAGQTVAASGPRAEVNLVRGDTLSGELVGATTDKLTVSTPAGEQVLPAAEVAAVDFDSPAEVESPRVWIELLDGSQIVAGSVAVAGGKATIELLGGDRLTDLPSRSIRAIRFHRPRDSELNPAWNEILAGTRAGDVLVLRKSATREVEENGGTRTVSSVTLDELEGTVLQVSTELVKFDFDGDKVDVKRDKLEGIVFFQPVKRELTSANLRMVDTSEGEWRIRTLEIAEGRLRATTPVGATIILPLKRVQRLDFSAGNVAMLAQLPMEASETSAALLPKGLSAAAVDWFHPLAGNRPGLTSASGKNQAMNLALTGKSLVSYRTPAGFRWFRASVILASKPGAGASVQVLVLGDGKTLATCDLLATDDRKPQLVEVDVTGVRRLSLQVIPREGQGLGALVDFQNARFTK